MKSKIMVFTTCLLFNLFTNACPVWHIGDIYIVDNSGNPINAKLWKIYINVNNEKDSFLINKSYHTIFKSNDKYITDTVSNRRCIYNHLWHNEMYYRIQANGYSDVILKNVLFKGEVFSINKDPELIVKMYPARYIKSGQNISLITEYVCNKKILINDSFVLDIKEYIENINISKINKTENPEQKLLLVETYPNPVSDILYININCNIKENWAIEITDETGKEKLKTEISSSFSTIDLSGFSNGFYIATLYNHQKLPIYNRRFLITKK